MEQLDTTSNINVSPTEFQSNTEHENRDISVPPYLPSPYKKSNLTRMEGRVMTPNDFKSQILFDLVATHTHEAKKIRELAFQPWDNREIAIRKYLVPGCIEFLSHNEDPGVQYEAARFIVNVTAGTSDWTMVVVNQGAIPKLVKLIESPIMDIAEQAVCALGNIAADNPVARDQILEKNCIYLLDLLEFDIPKHFTRDIIRTIGNLVRNSNLPWSSEAVQVTLPVLKHLLTQEDPDIVADAHLALSYLAEGKDGLIQVVVISDVNPECVALLASSDPRVLSSALDDVRNIVSGSDGLINAAPILRELIKLLDHEDVDIVKKVASVIRVVTARKREEIEDALTSETMSALFGFFRKGDFESKKEIAWALVNLLSKGFSYELNKWNSVEFETFFRFLKTRDQEDEVELRRGLLPLI